MTQYLVAIHHPDDFEPFSEPETTRQDIARSTGKWSRPGSGCSSAASPR